MVFVIRGTLLNLPLPSVDVRIKTSEVLLCLGLVLFLGGGLIFPISGNAFDIRWVVVSGFMTLGISVVLEKIPLPSAYEKMRTINVLNCFGVTLFIDSLPDTF
jgi:hypothetical protein